jgi:predicted transposase YdaD
MDKTDQPKGIDRSEIYTPHDKLFRKSMCTPEVAKDFLKMHLPEKYETHIDYATLEILKDSFVNERLKRSQVDALFKVKYHDEDLLIYILIEHQSQVDPTMPIRRLSYKSEIWAAYLEEHKGKKGIKIPPIVDLHFFTGSRPYDGPLSIGELAGEDAALVNASLTEPMINVWAGEVTPETLSAHPWAGTLEYIMRHREARDVRKVFREIGPYMRLFSVESQKGFVLSLYSYIQSTYRYVIPIEELALIAEEEISQEAGEDMRTIADHLMSEGWNQGMQRGMEEGMQQGMQQGLQKGLKKGLQQGMQQGIQKGLKKGMAQGKQEALSRVVKQMLDQGMELSLIHKITGVSLAELKALRESVTTVE